MSGQETNEKKKKHSIDGPKSKGSMQSSVAPIWFDNGLCKILINHCKIKSVPMFTYHVYVYKHPYLHLKRFTLQSDQTLDSFIRLALQEILTFQFRVTKQSQRIGQETLL